MALTAKNTGMNVEFIAESTRGTSPGSGQLYRVSDAVENVNLTARNNAEVAYSVYDYDGQNTYFGTYEYTLSFDYYLQRHGTNHPLTNSIEYYALTRSSGNLTPLTVFIHTNSSSTYKLAGSVVNRWTLTPEDKRIRCSVEMLCQSLATTNTSYATYTASNACGTTFETFSGAACTRGTSFNAGVNNFTFTINNKAAGTPVIGSSSPTAIYESLEQIDGTVGILLNDGGRSDYGVLYGKGKASIIFASGTSTATTNASMKWTLANTAYGELSIPFTTDTTIMVCPVRWTAETVTLAIYS